jgi:hypothetical protein
VLFIDKPGSDVPLGIWGVDATQSAEVAPQLLTERIAFYWGDLSYVLEYGGGETAIGRLDRPLGETQERWTVPASGRPISISPGRAWVAWQVSNDDLPFERRITQVWIANLDGTDARSVATLPRGGFSGWISDDVLLLSSRESLESRETVVYTLSLLDSTTAELLRAERPRGYELSPDRRWLVY